MIYPPLAAGSDRLAAPLRILRVISTLRPSAGGPREGLILSTEALARDGHMTEAATCDPPDATWLKDIALCVHPLGPSIGRSYFFTPRLVPWLKANRDRFDVVIAHGVWNFASVATWRGLKGGRTPYLLFTHGMLDPYFGRAQPWKWRAKQAFWWALEGRALSDAAAVLFTTEEERQLATQAFPGHRYRARVVAYGAAQPGGDPHAQVESFRAALPALGTNPFLLFLSRIHPKKGCDLLLEAFAFLADRRPDLHLVIAGPDETGWRAQLERLAVELGISQRVHWPGLLAGDRKWGAFGACEAFVLPSHQENFGIVVAEAMGCGAPVLITNKVNIWREVEAVGAGLVSSDDRQGVTDLLSRFLELGPAERRLMGERAKAAARERFSIEAAAADLMRAVEEIRV
jgi:glycosyltransferase involved in cell wall biosynthesis